MSGPHKPVRQKKENLLMRNRMYLMALASVMLVGCGGTPPQKDAPPAATAVSSAPSLPATISAKRGGFIPEGVENDKKTHRLLTGPLAEGTIFQWQADGNLTPLVTDADLKSSVGIEADEERDRLLVCNSDAAVFQGKVVGQAKLGIYNLTTGAKIAMVDLAATDTGVAKDAKHFANDVAVERWIRLRHRHPDQRGLSSGSGQRCFGAVPVSRDQGSGAERDCVPPVWLFVGDGRREPLQDADQQSWRRH